MAHVQPHVWGLARRIAALSPKEQKQLSVMCHDRLVARPLGAGKSWKPPPSTGMLPFPHPGMIFTNQVPQVGVLPQELPSVSQSVQAFHFEELLEMMGGSWPTDMKPAEATNATDADNSEAPVVEEESVPTKAGEEATAPKIVKALKLTSFPDQSKIKIIKEIRHLLGLGLKEAKDAAENLPKVLAKQVPREEADVIAAKFIELGGEAGLSKGNVRMHVTTKKYCNLGLVDASGKPAPCGISKGEETYGFTLPGMEDGVQTTIEDVVIAKDGQVSVQASPALPYTYLMSVNSPGYNGVEKLYNHQSFVVSEEVPDDAAEASTLGETLADDGWIPQESDEASTNKWLLYGPQGVDPVTGANYTALYQTGVAPDAWILYTDETNENPRKLLAVNTFLNDRVFQESTFDEVESLGDDITVAEAVQAVYATYQVDGGRRLTSGDDFEAPHVDAEMIDAPFVSEKTRQFFSGEGDWDWMSKRKLRSSQGFKGISYFTIEKGSAADKYFHAAAQRGLAEIVKFEYPKGCVAAGGKQEQKYCIFVSVDASLDPSVTLKAGMSFLDIHDATKSAHLSIGVTLKKDEGSMLSLTIDAGGCAVVFQYGQPDETHLSISVCMASKDPAKKKADGTIEGEVAITVRFMVHINHVGDLIDWDIDAKVNCTAAPKNEITAYGVIGTSASAKVAYAAVSLDLKANTLEHAYNKWHFVSGVDFHAWAGVWKFKKHWDYRWQLYEAGPVTI
ncbi:Has a dual role in the assembly of mitochondrial ATPase [Perkinsus olseni]|uniref:Has a dual role in the assembly of mitochondrial ATPase n=1 Tax=Perkinsus olseni TaxID=32597 RepID=A0A7J6NQH3_PEROL|nr:Has a dual role in the assembly of mitochondrial ATPase [Perkinsus olseni]